MSDPDGSSGTGASGAGASSTTSTNISDLTDGLKQIQKKGVDLKLSKDTANKYLGVVNDYRTALKAQLTAAQGLPDLGTPPNLNSANDTRTNLVRDSSGPNGFQDMLGQYLKYLDEFYTTLQKASGQLVDSG
jgi:hypothetical protein